LIEAHHRTLSPIIAPQIDGQRGTPVLFDRKTFPDLLTLDGDTGGRNLFRHYPVHWIPWIDRNQLLDVDTPKDYQKFMEIYGDDA
jgi:molybdenum cofactor cytidylyltransferase